MSTLNKIANFVIHLIGKVHWKADKIISSNEQSKIRDMLTSDYYLILTRRETHLSTFFIGLANLFLRGKWGYWSHVLMNLEDEVNTKKDFRLLEAIKKGVAITPFDEVFNVQAVAFLKPKHMKIEAWTAVLDRAKSNLGKPYDTLFDLANDQAMSCVELVRCALMAEPNYTQNFKNFEAMIKKSKNLTPQMFFDCEDFVVVYEVKCQ